MARFSCSIYWKYGKGLKIPLCGRDETFSAQLLRGVRLKPVLRTYIQVEQRWPEDQKTVIQKHTQNFLGKTKAETLISIQYW